MRALTLLLNGTPIEKLQFLFKVYDVDGKLHNVFVSIQYTYSLSPPLSPSPVGDGTIKYDELKTILKCCMNESSLTFTEENLEELTRYISYKL